jgi:CheY-like chemotaxis protein
MTSGTRGAGGLQVAVVADDLIWSTRLDAGLRAAGATPLRVTSPEGLAACLPGVDAVVVDLTARAYDGIAAVARAAEAGRPVIALGQHDDHALRRRALAAGASRVYAYRKLAADGPAVLAGWLAKIDRPAIAT